ncbi:hypothetical protein [Neobittarella massiliensis]|uniref:hypothetical protein n=1 Tax=Neobittarella massiliensis (ex Bilen et al. 2018) TaxID=2041842 RepID=UPI000CF623F2|nr:hypothetical protein [Neobittarella massiliensis]
MNRGDLLELRKRYGVVEWGKREVIRTGKKIVAEYNPRTGEIMHYCIQCIDPENNPDLIADDYWLLPKFYFRNAFKNGVRFWGEATGHAPHRLLSNKN